MAHLRLLVRLGPCLLLAALVSRSARAEGIVVHGESERASQRFEEACRKEAAARKDPSEERWGEVVGAYQTLLASAGDELIPVQGQDGLLVPVRWLCHARLALLPPAALRLYRGRVDARAAQWLEQGQRERDVRLLRRVVEENFASRAGKAALDLLGDLAFERGDFSEAEFWWRLLAPGPGERPAPFLPRYPGTPEDEARAQAKQLLARWFAGASRHPASWRRDLEVFRQRYPEAQGHLAGARDLYWKRLKTVAEAAPPETVVAHRGWPTFAGAASRNRVVRGEEASPVALARLCRHGHHWTFPLGNPAPGFRPLARASDFGRTLAFQPVIAGNQVLVADGRFVTAYDIATGKFERWCDVTHFPDTAKPNLNVPAPADLRFTLTVAGDCVLARVGLADLRSDRKEAEAVRTGGNYLVCLNRRPDERGNRLRWRAAPGTAPGNVAFEGTAVAANGRAYIAATRFDEGRSLTAIHCYPLDARDVAPLLWKQDVCTTRALPAGEVRYRHHLLTLAGPNVVYCSHSGVIMALDAATGRRAWAVRYRRGRSQGDKAPLAPRDLNPCVYAGGKLFVAPADTDQLLCLDPSTGRALWSRERIEAVHLLGVGQARLIFTTTTPRIGLRAVRAEDGSDRGGWFRTAAHGDAPLVLFGRGFLAGEQVYWPTFRQVHALGQRDGAPQDDPSLLHAVPAGNLVFGNGTLAVADRTTLHIFAPAATRLQERKAAVREQPDSALAHYYLAAAEADAGEFVHAEKDLRAAERLASGEEQVAGRQLADLLRQDRHDLLLRAAGRAAAGKRWQEAAALLSSAAGADFPPRSRLRALARLCGLWRRAGQPARTADVCRAILAEKALHREHLPDVSGNPQSARCWALDRLSRLTPPDTRSSAAAVEKLVRRGARAVAGVLEGRQPLPLTLPLLRSWHLALPPGGSFVPLETGQPDVITTVFSQQTTGDERLLRCHDARTGKVEWQRAVPAPASWFGRAGDGVIAGGREKVVCLSARGEPLWEYDAPFWGGKRLPLSAFRLAGSRLFFVQGGRLFALDAARGRVLWTRWRPSAFASRAAAARPFAADYRVNAYTVEVPELGWCLDSQTGDLLPDPQQRSPSLVCGRESGTGKVLWKYEVPGPTTLTGEPSRILDLSAAGDRRSCLLIAFHNYGTTLQRLEQGRPCWSRPVVFRPNPVWPSGMSSDADAVYFVYDGVLTSLGMDDGRKRWERPLAGAGARGIRWRTLRAGEYVLAYPAEGRRLSCAVPLSFGMVECGLTLAAEFPVVICDRKTGKLVQRLNLPWNGTRLWLRRNRADGEEAVQPAVAVMPGGLSILLGDRAWGVSFFPEG